jgi:microcystin-dependent protein
MPSKTIAIKTACFLFSILGLLTAEVPRQIAYQGILTDPKGNPKPDGTYQVAFNLYSSETGGTALWTQTEELATKSGMFATMLGSVKPLSLPFNQQYWLGVAVGGKELAPRVKLAAAAYSLRADTAEVAKTVTNAAHATNSDTATYVKNIVIATGSIDSTSIKDSTITGKDINRNANLTIAGLVTSGNVGIGTPNPTYKFGLETSNPGLGTGGPIAEFRDTYVENGHGNMSLGVITDNRYAILPGVTLATLSNHPLSLGTNGSTIRQMTISTTGNVGIGTSTPAAKLEILGDDTAKIIVSSSTKNIYATLISGSSGSFTRTVLFSSGMLAFGPYGSTQITLRSNDNGATINAGIGTINPSSKLEVAGRIKDSTGFVSPVGSMMMYAGSAAPAGWLMCDGAAVSRTTYATLFSILGATYGAGNGSSTFNVPDMRRRVPVGAGGTSSATLGNGIGNTGGEESHTLTSSESGNPSHIHGIADPGHTHDILIDGWSAKQGKGGTSGAYWDLSLEVTPPYNNSGDRDLYTNSVATGISVNNNTSAAASSAHNTVQPSLVINYIIKY